MRHFSLWPLRWEAACGAQGVALFGELDLVTCPECRRVVVRAEILACALPDAV